MGSTVLNTLPNKWAGSVRKCCDGSYWLSLSGDPCYSADRDPVDQFDEGTCIGVEELAATWQKELEIPDEEPQN